MDNPGVIKPYRLRTIRKYQEFFAKHAPPEKVVETSFQRWLARRWGRIWHSYIEPASGSTIGTPDVMVLLPGQCLVLPVELKMTVCMREDRLKPHYLRPAQIQWHDGLARRGGLTCLLLAEPLIDGGFRCWVQPNCRHEVLKDWRQGFPIESLTCVFNETDIVLNYSAWKACMALG
jgi:hypothetical protein